MQKPWTSSFHRLLVAIALTCSGWVHSTIADDEVGEISSGGKSELVTGIDRFMAASWDRDGVEIAGRCDDETFVRRVYLDLAGRVPTTKELSEFLESSGSDKRDDLIDQLLASEDHVQHFADVFDALMMGRADEGKYAQRIKHGWRSYLENAIRRNRPWNEMAREILLARPGDDSQRGAVWYLYERNNQHQAIAESVAPVFFGIRIECAQCHDHMSVDEIKQEHYWGLVAFFNRGKNQKSKLGLSVAESAVGGFSEFADLTGDSKPNLLTFLHAETVAEPRPTAGEKQEDRDEMYREPSIEGATRIPLFSRRQRFADDILSGHPLLPRAMVNRLWALMYGRGLVHPFDEMDSDHPPSHPDLLDWLALEFEERDFQLRPLLRAMARSRAYQLASLRPASTQDPATFAWYLERPLTAEQLARSVQLVVRGAYSDRDPLVADFRQTFRDVLPEETTVKIGDALFLSNSRRFDDFLASGRSEDGLMHRAGSLPSAEGQVTLLFRTALGRDPDAEEMSAVVDFLDRHASSQENALQQVTWSLLTSAEFRFNH